MELLEGHDFLENLCKETVIFCYAYKCNEHLLSVLISSHLDEFCLLALRLILLQLNDARHVLARGRLQAQRNFDVTVY